jgi:tRNA pseudouridine(55) synthase
MDGLLVIDKPIGPTSHDVVARVRRALGERRIGHTGTLDPLASGVLPLVIGRATRLARFLSGEHKRYHAAIRLGWATDSGDADGETIGPKYEGVMPSRADIDRALDAFRGAFVQQPPRLSAKKIQGVRSHRLARGAAGLTAPLPEPVPVSTEQITIVEVDGDRVEVDVICSAGFYVRALADDLGQSARDRRSPCRAAQNCKRRSDPEQRRSAGRHRTRRRPRPGDDGADSTRPNAPRLPRRHVDRGRRTARIPRPAGRAGALRWAVSVGDGARYPPPWIIRRPPGDGDARCRRSFAPRRCPDVTC